MELITNQQAYDAGDNFILGATYGNPGNPLLVNVYISVTGSGGNIFSIPDLSLGDTPLMTNFELPRDFSLTESRIFSFPVSADFSGAGQFKIEAFLTYSGTLTPVGESSNSSMASFP